MPAPPAGVVLRTYLRGICGRSGCGKNWRIGRGLAMRAVETLGTGMEAAEPGIIPVKTRPQWLRGGPRLARLAWLRWRWQITFLFGGCMIGVAGVVMALGAAAAERQFARLLAAYPYASLLVTPAGFAWLAWVTRRFVPNSEGSGIPQAIAARRLWDQNERRRLVSLKIGLGKILLTLAGLLCGASIGREGPTVQVGASIMFAVGRLSPARQRGLILAGAAAGIAAAFNTPLAGVVFAIEEMSRAFDERANTLVIGAIIAAGLVSSAWLGNYTYFGVTAANLGSGVGWAAVPLCGVAGGLLGGLFSRALVAFATGLPAASASVRRRLRSCGRAVRHRLRQYGLRHRLSAHQGRYRSRRRAAAPLRHIEDGGDDSLLGGRYSRRTVFALARGGRRHRLRHRPAAAGSAGQRHRDPRHGGLFFRRGAGADHRLYDRRRDDRRPQYARPADGHFADRHGGVATDLLGRRLSYPIAQLSPARNCVNGERGGRPGPVRRRIAAACFARPGREAPKSGKRLRYR